MSGVPPGNLPGILFYLAVTAVDCDRDRVARPAGRGRRLRQAPPPDDTSYGPVHGTTVRVITAGGTPGWQITLIAVAAAPAAAAAAVFLDRARASRRSASSAG